MAIDSVEEAARRWSVGAPDERARLGPTLIAAAGDAVRELAGRLEDLDYPVDGMVVPCEALDDALLRFEETGPPVPPALVEVWRGIGCINFVDLGRYRHLAFWEQRLGAPARVHACDGVVVEGPCADDGWIDYVLDLFDEQVEVGMSPAFPLGPDALHKDDTSGGDGYELVPEPSDPWLASIREFAWTGPARPVTAPPGSSPDLVSYLRTSILECAGFPGLLGVQAFEPLRRELVDGLAVF